MTMSLEELTKLQTLASAKYISVDCYDKLNDLRIVLSDLGMIFNDDGYTTDALVIENFRDFIYGITMGTIRKLDSLVKVEEE